MRNACNIFLQNKHINYMVNIAILLHVEIVVEERLSFGPNIIINRVGGCCQINTRGRITTEDVEKDAFYFIIYRKRGVQRNGRNVVIFAFICTDFV